MIRDLCLTVNPLLCAELYWKNAHESTELFQVMHNGTTVIDDYGQNLDKLKVGDRVAVVRKEGGTVHFFVNRSDLTIFRDNKRNTFT